MIADQTASYVVESLDNETLQVNNMFYFNLHRFGIGTEAVFQTEHQAIYVVCDSDRQNTRSVVLTLSAVGVDWADAVSNLKYLLCQLFWSLKHNERHLSQDQRDKLRILEFYIGIRKGVRIEP